MKKLEGMVGIPLQAVKDKAKVDKLKATEATAIAAFGEHRIERKYRPDGNYSWKVKLEQNDGHGELTKDGHAMQEMLMPWMRADSERGMTLQAGVPRAALMDGAGSVQYVPAESADATAKANGWKHRPYFGRGQMVMRTYGGKLWKRERGKWVEA